MKSQTEQQMFLEASYYMASSDKGVCFYLITLPDVPVYEPSLKRDPVPTVQETGWALGQVWSGAENTVKNISLTAILPVTNFTQTGAHSGFWSSA